MQWCGKALNPDGTEEKFMMGYRYDKIRKAQGMLVRVAKLELEEGQTFENAWKAKEKKLFSPVLPRVARNNNNIDLVKEDEKNIKNGAYPRKLYPHRADPLHKLREPEAPLLLPKGTPCWNARMKGIGNNPSRARASCTVVGAHGNALSASFRSNSST